jgi:hypothetical protein
MKITNKLGWILALSALLAPEAGAQSSVSSNRLSQPYSGLKPGGQTQGNLEDDVRHTGSIVKFAIPLPKPRFLAGPGSTAQLQAAARDLTALRHAATGVRIDYAALAAAAVRLADRQLDEVGESLALLIASPAGGLIEIDVRKHVSSFEVSVDPIGQLGNPTGGLTPGGQSTSAFLQVASPAGGLIELDVRKHVSRFEVSLDPIGKLPKPFGGFTPGGKSTNVSYARAAQQTTDRR